MASDFDYYVDKFYELVLFADQSILNDRVNEAKEILINTTT